MSYSKDDVKEQLEAEDVMLILEFFDAEPEMFDDYIISRTVCHQGDSRKLYYYCNSQLFYCYTHCGYFDIFELVQKIKGIDLNEAVYFVVNFLNLQYKLQDVDEIEYSEDWKYFQKQEELKELQQQKEQSKLILPEIDLSILQYYPKPRYLNWEKEGIEKEVCDYCGICYDPLGGNILIPHFDENNRCIGIRQRTLVKENEQWGKYKPWRHWDNQKNKLIIYNHALAFNLYGFNWAKENIRKNGIVIVTESEKAVQQYISYFGLANNLCVAVCGSSLSRYQFNLLMECGVKEIVIAFDKDFETIDSKEREEVEDKFTKIYNKFGSEVNMSFLFDSQCNVLGYKASPLDEGKDKFLYLFRNRVIIG